MATVTGYIAQDWQPWNPVYDGGAMTVADATGAHASGNLSHYKRVGDTCFFEHARILNKGGVPSALITLTLPPLAPKFGRATFVATVDNGPAYAGLFDSFTVLGIKKPPAYDSGSVLFIAGAHWVTVSGFYAIED